MFNRFPIFGKRNPGVRRGFAITDKSATGTKTPTFNAVTYRESDGSQTKLVSIGQLSNKSHLGAVGTPMQPTMRIARVTVPGAGGAGQEMSFFLLSCWAAILPGTVPGKMYYSPHLKAYYDARETTPAWLDWLINLGQSFRVRDYLPWMDDTQIYKAGHGRNITDTQHNNYSHAGRLGLLVRCCLGSGLDPSLLLAVFLSPCSTVLSYFVHVDTNLNYWLVKVTRTEVARALIIWHSIADPLHAQMKLEVGAGNRISRTSAEHELLRNKEGYLFAAAKKTTAFETIATIEVEGSSIGYGWDSNWDGTKAVHTTVEYPYPVEEGIRCRLYDMEIEDTSVVLTERVNALGTPDLSVLTGYTPNRAAIPGNMEAWFQKSLTESWTHIATLIPLYAYFEEEDDDTPCEWWFQADLKTYHAPAGNHNTWIATLSPQCGTGVTYEEGYSNGGYSQYKGLFSVNKASGNEDYRKRSREVISGQLYTAQWEVYETNTGCIRIGGGGTFGLSGYDCGDWDDSPPGPSTVTATEYHAEYTTEDYTELHEIHYSTFMLNFNNPKSFTVIDYFSASHGGYSEGWGGWNGVGEAHASEYGTFVCKFNFPQTYPTNCADDTTKNCNEIRPDYAPMPYVFTSPRPCPAPNTYYFNQNECCVYLPTPLGAAKTREVIHTLNTQRGTIELFNGACDGECIDSEYLTVQAPLFQYPWFDHTVFCRLGVENQIYSGDFIDFTTKTDLDISEEYIGQLTLPTGLA